jgi:hypothetical protein
MSQNRRNKGFSYYFCLMIQGCGSGSRTNGSGSGRPKNRIRIPNTGKNGSPSGGGDVWEEFGREEPSLEGPLRDGQKEEERNEENQPVHRWKKRVVFVTVQSDKTMLRIRIYIGSGIKGGHVNEDLGDPSGSESLPDLTGKLNLILGSLLSPFSI